MIGKAPTGTLRWDDGCRCGVPPPGPGGGRTWWAHFEFTRINITPTILRKKIQEPRIVGALRVSPRSVMVLYAGRSPSDTVPPRTAAAVPYLARPMMRCRGTVILGALRAQSGGPVQNELTLREMVNGISALFAVMTPDGAVEDVNHAVLDYFGKTLEELKQWASTDAVHPDDLPGVIAVWSRSLESGQPYDIELRQ